MRALLGAALATAFAGAAWAQTFDVVERGRALVIAADCVACHTQQGGAPFAGGRPIATPFGVLLSPNITPDRETGIGAWTDAAFVRALAEGIGRDGRHLYPAMPYPYFTRMPQADILAIRAYLDTLAPQRHMVVANQLPFPFGMRATMRAWNALYFTPGTTTVDASRPADWNRGAYLVQGPGHCGACHTPKTALGGDHEDQALQGATLDGWLAPDLTNAARTGLGRWDIDDLVAYLQTGHSRQASAGGPMAEVVMASTSRMPPEDLRAIAVYLKSQPAPARAAPQAASADTPAMQLGQAIYVDNCTACHGADGAGAPGLFPTLRGNAAVQSGAAENAVRLILHGGRSAATPMAPTGPAMPAFGWKLSDQQVAALVTYIRNAWGNAAPVLSASVVDDARRAGQ